MGVISVKTNMAYFKVNMHKDFEILLIDSKY